MTTSESEYFVVWLALSFGHPFLSNVSVIWDSKKTSFMIMCLYVNSQASQRGLSHTMLTSNLW